MNLFSEYCKENDRPFKYIADKAGIPYFTLLRHKDKPNSELRKSLTFAKVQKLKKVIPNIETILNGE